MSNGKEQPQPAPENRDGASPQPPQQPIPSLPVPGIRTKTAAFFTGSRADQLWKALPGFLFSLLVGWLVTCICYLFINDVAFPLDPRKVDTVLENARNAIVKNIPDATVVIGEDNSFKVVLKEKNKAEIAVINIEVITSNGAIVGNWAFRKIYDLFSRTKHKRLEKITVTLSGAAGSDPELSVRPIILFERSPEQPDYLFFATHSVSMPASVHALQKALSAFPKGLAESPELTRKKISIETDKIEHAVSVLGKQLKNLELIGPEFNWNRRYNGKIQFMTVWAFWIAMLQMISRLWLHCSLERRIRHSVAVRDLWESNTELFDERLVKSLLQLCEKAQSELIQKSQFGWTCARSAYLDIYHAAVAAFKVEGDYKSVPAFADSQAATLGDERNAGLGLIKYLIWSIPSLGFIGTVVGIGDALLETVNVDSVDVAESAIAKSMVSSNIGVAFDTTLVALLLSLVAMLTYYLLLQFENLIVHSATADAINRFVKPGKVIPNNVLTAKLIKAINHASMATSELKQLSPGLARYAKAARNLAEQMNNLRTRSNVLSIIIVLFLCAILSLLIWRLFF